MASASTDSQELFEQRFTALLQPYFADLYRVTYEPAFPRQDGSTFRWFQLVFAVGPADDATARAQVHERFAQLLGILAPFPEVQHTHTVSLRARRHVPPRTAPDHPHMFIEGAWHGSALADLQRIQDFSAWHSYCSFYVNRLDRHDPLNSEIRNA